MDAGRAMTVTPPLEEGFPPGTEPVDEGAEIPADSPTPTEDTPPKEDSDLKIFGREPALVVGALNALIMLAATLGFSGLTGTEAPLWVGLVNAVSAAILAITIRPLSVGVFSQVIGALVALLAGYGLNLSSEFVFALNGTLLPILMFFTRGQASPITTPLTQPSLDPTIEAARKEGKATDTSGPVETTA